jgi:DNA invertase Pin-like site-specific DNA recombinase
VERDQQRTARLEAQRQRIGAACTRQRWQPIEQPEEACLSATDNKRPGIKEAHRLLKSGDQHALVAAKRGPLSHLLVDLASLVASAQKQGWALVALDCALQPKAPAEEQRANILATFAPCERGLISQRTRKALARARAQGIRLGRPPTMSRYVIERIKRERAAGKSLTTIANGLNADRIPTAQGGQRWYPATIRYTLNRTP